jgi:L-asparaginase II
MAAGWRRKQSTCYPPVTACSIPCYEAQIQAFSLQFALLSGKEQGMGARKTALVRAPP